MESKPIRIGVVGVNFGAAVHVPAFQSEGLEVIAVCSRRQERAAEVVQRFGVEHAFTDLDEMLRLDGLDAVSHRLAGGAAPRARAGGAGGGQARDL